MKENDVQTITLTLEIGGRAQHSVSLNLDELSAQQIHHMRHFLPDFVMDLSEKLVQKLIARGFQSEKYWSLYRK